LADGWTVVTADGALSAHYENTVAITPDGVIVMTKVDE
jgi:methionyl aminopeptidase